MSYLEQLKLENTHSEELPTLTEPPFDGFDSRSRRHFSEKQAPDVVVEINTPTGRRSVIVASDSDDDRITGAAIYQGCPTPDLTNLADRILTFIAGRDGPVSEGEIISAVASGETIVRTLLGRLCIEGLVEPVGGGRYRIPAWPPQPSNLPEGCPILGGPVTGGCRFDPRLFMRLMAEGTLPLPGGRCPYRHICRLDQQKKDT